MRALRPFAVGLALLVFGSAIVVPTLVYANSISVETGGTQYVPALVCTNNTTGVASLAIPTNTRFYLDGPTGSRYFTFDTVNINSYGGNLVVNGGGVISTGDIQTVTQYKGWSTSPVNLLGLMADGATAIATKISSNATYTTSGAKLLSVNNNTTEKFYVDKDGKIQGDTLFFQGGNMSVAYSAAEARFTTTSGGSINLREAGGQSFLSLTGAVADGASAVGATSDTTNALSNAAAKLWSWKTATVEKAYVSGGGAFVTASTNGYGTTNAAGQGLTFAGNSTSVKAGTAGSAVFLSDQSVNMIDATATRIAVDATSGIIMAPKTLPTCGASIEWAMLPDVASGVATGKRSKMCLCTSDGASAYKWQNMATATLGTTTTCGTE